MYRPPRMNRPRPMVTSVDDLLLDMPLVDSTGTKKGRGPVTFTRAAKCLTTDADGTLRTFHENEPAFTGARWESENLLRYSEDWTWAGWAKSAETTFEAPNKLTKNASGARVTQTISAIPSTTLTFSTQLAAGSTAIAIQLLIYNNTRAGAVKSVSTIPVQSNLGTIYSITALPTDGVGIAVGDQVTVYIYIDNSSANGTYIMLGKAWLNSGGAILSYVKTVDYPRNSVSAYDAGGVLLSSCKGILIEPARTNKCTNYNANPVNQAWTVGGGALGGVALTGDAASTLSVVDDSAMLTSAGLHVVCASGKVYKLDNSAGTGSSYATFSGVCGNLNSHNASVYYRGGSGALRDSYAGSLLSLTGSTNFTRAEVTFTPTNINSQFVMQASSGQIVYFILNQLEEGAVVTSPIVIAGASATRASSCGIEGSRGLRLPLSGNFTDTFTISCNWHHDYDAAALPDTSAGVVTIDGTTMGLIYLHASNRPATYDGTNAIVAGASAPLAGYTKLCVSCSKPSAVMGMAMDGVDATPNTYDGLYQKSSEIIFFKDNEAPNHLKNLKITSKYSDSAKRVALTPEATEYGVAYNIAAGTFYRTGKLATFPVGSSPGDANLPIHSGIKRCLLLDNGTVNYYLDPANSTLKEGGGASNLTGADGQVMVEIPAFYYRFNYTGLSLLWSVSMTPQPGYSIHPAFIKNGSQVSKRYIGAYEGVLRDVSAGNYVSGLYLPPASTMFSAAANSITQTTSTKPFAGLKIGDKIFVLGTTYNNGTFTVSLTGDQTIVVTEDIVTGEVPSGCFMGSQKDWVNDILSSVHGVTPMGYTTRANFRKVASNRGAGWRQLDFDLLSAIQLLFLVEYGSFDAQSVIGAGFTDWAEATWLAYNKANPVTITGLSNSKGNGTFSVSSGDGLTGSYMTYRGIENLYGHMWTWVDGLNVSDNMPYVTNDDAAFADDTATGYTAIGATMASADNWIATILPQGRGFLPATVAASEDKIHDFYYQAAGWRVVRVGGSVKHGNMAGLFHMGAGSAATHSEEYYGARLAY